MAVDQVVLARVIAGAPNELSAANSSLLSMNNMIISIGQEDTLYKAMMVEAKTQLEASLAAKVTWFDTNFPADAPHSVVYGGYYGFYNISDWYIKKSSGTVVYRYSKAIATAWSRTLASYTANYWTVRNMITGVSQNLDWLRVGISGVLSSQTLITMIGRAHV